MAFFQWRKFNFFDLSKVSLDSIFILASIVKFTKLLHHMLLAQKEPQVLGSVCLICLTFSNPGC